MKQKDIPQKQQKQEKKEQVDETENLKLLQTIESLEHSKTVLEKKFKNDIETLKGRNKYLEDKLE